MVLEVQQVSGDIDACGGVPEQQPDAGFLRLLAGKEADGRLLCFAGEDGFGQRRLVVREFRLSTDEDDVAFIPLQAQGLGSTHAAG